MLENPHLLRHAVARGLFGWVRRKPQEGHTHILVHGGCADGYTSAGLLLRRYPDARVHYTHPTEVRRLLERLADRSHATRVVLADLSPQAKDLDDILNAMRRLAPHAFVAWLDHHAPQWPAPFEAALRELGVDVVVDRGGTESGASLAASWCQEKDPKLLRVADLIRQRDAWTNPHDPEARAWTLVAGKHAHDYVHRLAKGHLEGLADEGRALLQADDAHVAQAVARAHRHGETVAWIWGTLDISDVADRAFREDKRLVVFVKFEPSARVSLRSRAERPVAATLAQRFGGGGHPNAAGFGLPLNAFRRVVYRWRRAKDPAVRKVLAAAEALTRAEPEPSKRQ